MKQPKRILVLSPSEYRLILHGLLHFRNKLIEQNRYTRMPSTNCWRSSSEPGGAIMDKIAVWLKVYIDTHPFDPGDSDCETVLDQLYQAYAESHESDPPEISEGFKELEEFLCSLPLGDNNAVFNLCCRLCSAYERKAFIDGLQYGAHLMLDFKFTNT